jgi:hypothetical protein
MLPLGPGHAGVAASIVYGIRSMSDETILEDTIAGAGSVVETRTPGTYRIDGGVTLGDDFTTGYVEVSVDGGSNFITSFPIALDVPPSFLSAVDNYLVGIHGGGLWGKWIPTYENGCLLSSAEWTASGIKPAPYRPVTFTLVEAPHETGGGFIGTEPYTIYAGPDGTWTVELAQGAKYLVDAPGNGIYEEITIPAQSEVLLKDLVAG